MVVRRFYDLLLGERNYGKMQFGGSLVGIIVGGLVKIK